MRCAKTPGVDCVRAAGHKGTCTANPSSATLDWDEHYQEIREKHERDAQLLEDLDWPTPDWDGRDEGEPPIMRSG